MTQKSGTQFNCFSPPVMIASLVIEMSLALYTIWRYKMSNLSRLVVLSLVALATFQFCEYRVCTGYGLSAEQWSRLGYVAITTLPPLGLHALHIIAGKSQRKTVVISYATMVGFIGYFLTYSAAFIGYKCTGNYVIFQIGAGPAIAYGLYYYGWLFTAIVLGIKWARSTLKKAGETIRQNQMTEALVIGYLVFLVPTAISNTVSPATRSGIPSIMCGFAVLYAVILTLYILPRGGKLRRVSCKV
ncbi:MAG: hypothetical protein JWM81_370 [Candidatus Saccharibacteria bacterium]|nr:hypothetical protein [Candidatus Saccharibacteria bacterium]